MKYVTQFLLTVFSTVATVIERIIHLNTRISYIVVFLMIPATILGLVILVGMVIFDSSHAFTFSTYLLTSIIILMTYGMISMWLEDMLICKLLLKNVDVIASMFDKIFKVNKKEKTLVKKDGVYS